MNVFFRYFFYALLFFNSVIYAEITPTHWTTLTPGIDYTTISKESSNRHGRVHAFRIDLHQYHLDLLPAKNMAQTSIFANQAATHQQVLLAINGGFFNPNLQPLGLRIKSGVTLSPLKKISWWGAFIIANNTATIISEKEYRYSPKISFAIQAGPRLLVNGKPNPLLRPGVAERSALGITRSGKVIIAVTENLPLTTLELAEILAGTEASGGLDCWQALNLDGGSSSQLYAKIGNFTLDVQSLRPVADLVILSKN